MKTLLLGTMLTLSTLSISGVFAQSTQSPAAQLDGTDISISAESIEEMRRWAMATNTMLEDLLRRAAFERPSRQVMIYKRGIEELVLNSGEDRNKLIMRSILNRALEMERIFDEAIGTDDSRGVVDFKLRLFKNSILLAKEYYVPDLAYLESENQSTTLLPYAQFGARNAQMLITLSRSLVNANAQFSVLHKALAYLQSDLSRDQLSQLYAQDFTRINNALRMDRAEDGDSTEILLLKIQALKRMIEILDLHDGRGGIASALLRNPDESDEEHTLRVTEFRTQNSQVILDSDRVLSFSSARDRRNGETISFVVLANNTAEFRYRNVQGQVHTLKTYTFENTASDVYDNATRERQRFSATRRLGTAARNVNNWCYSENTERTHYMFDFKTRRYSRAILTVPLVVIGCSLSSAIALLPTAVTVLIDVFKDSFGATPRAYRKLSRLIEGSDVNLTHRSFRRLLNIIRE